MKSPQQQRGLAVFILSCLVASGSAAMAGGPARDRAATHAVSADRDRGAKAGPGPKRESFDPTAPVANPALRMSRTMVVPPALQTAAAGQGARWFVYGLALLALAGAVAAAWAWRRRGNAEVGSSRKGDASPPRIVIRVTRPAALTPSHEPHYLEPQYHEPQHHEPPEDPVWEPPQDTLPPPAPVLDLTPLPQRHGFDAGTVLSPRALQAKALHDVQQQAAFSLSMGEFDRAIEVLLGHLRTGGETSAVAWLELMEIYRQLDRRNDYDWVRQQFQHDYNAEVAEFDHYVDLSAGIEDYENAMSRIVPMWPTRRALDLIEEWVFLGPTRDGTHAFTLQAYRDLLLLHTIGTDVLGHEDEPTPPFLPRPGPDAELRAF